MKEVSYTHSACRIGSKRMQACLSGERDSVACKQAKNQFQKTLQACRP